VDVVQIHAPLKGDDKSPVLVLLPGAGGWYKLSDVPLQKAPCPCWHVVFHAGGRHKVRKPDYVHLFLTQIRFWTRETGNKIIVLGYSRGAAWIVDLVRDNAACLDAAIALAPYPWTSCPHSNKHEARELMQVRRLPLLLIHFAEDAHCHPAKYPQWFSQFALAQAVEEGHSYGQRAPTFYSTTLPGEHDRGYALMQSLNFESTGHDTIAFFWRHMWNAVQGLS
jgi:pimeloyl-ACP methyl ester carboxylesterase